MTRYEIYLEILRRGLLDIRASCADRKQCFAQSDHLHNLPELLRNFDKEELHDFYWTAMRQSYVDSCQPDRAHLFDDLWAQLESVHPDR